MEIPNSADGHSQIPIGTANSLILYVQFVHINQHQLTMNLNLPYFKVPLGLCNVGLGLSPPFPTWPAVPSAPPSGTQPRFPLPFSQKTLSNKNPPNIELGHQSWEARSGLVGRRHIFRSVWCTRYHPTQSFSTMQMVTIIENHFQAVFIIWIFVRTHTVAMLFPAQKVETRVLVYGSRACEYPTGL